ncbi:hypothetical protein [Pseudomonas lopnurensis]|uniref:hypothetical protein n=1 Tax=Pseudomonas lopnurensis TaxID=1477517 RepID=UPI0018796E7F|nr:hypothetical protein [Pseudomonas lopnurensis]MBE7373020.1 hypothetical protein [Pseudomonas lopnurensis]
MSGQLRWMSLFFLMFPWISFGIFDLDTQPYYIVISVIVVLFSLRSRLPSFIFLLYINSLLVGLLACITAFRVGFGFSEMRAIASYFGLAVSVHVFYLLFRDCPYFTLRFILLANIVWVFAGVAQVVWGKAIFSFLVSVRTTDDRGVTSLAPEPSYFAVMLVFISWVYFLVSDYRPANYLWLMILVNALCVVFFAKSAFGLLLLLILFFGWFIYNFRYPSRLFFLWCGVVGLGAMAAGLLYFDFFPSSRLVALIQRALADPLLLIFKDASLNARASHVVIPLYGAWQDFFIPHGFSYYQLHSEGLVKYFNGFFWYGYAGSRIMSSVAAPIYELGWLAFFFFFSLFVSFMATGRGWVINLSIMFFFLVGAVPISFPLVGAVIAIVNVAKPDKCLLECK